MRKDAAKPKNCENKAELTLVICIYIHTTKKWTIFGLQNIFGQHFELESNFGLAKICEMPESYTTNKVVYAYLIRHKQ